MIGPDKPTSMKLIRLLSLWLIPLGVAAVVLGVVWGSGESAEQQVRVQARSLDDGRVEVAIQQHLGDSWSERHLPVARIVPVDAETGRWLSSSPVTLASATTAMPDMSMADEQEPARYCLVTHERPGDEEFWGLVSFGARQWDALHDSIDVEVHAGVDAEAQSNKIDECIDNGAIAIGVTLPDPEGVKAAIGRAIAAGVYVNSFNSGARDYAVVGSIRHVSVNEFAAGQRAGVLFNEADVSGVALCVIHEVSNIGLEERCDGLADGFDGEVRRLNVGETGLADREATGAAIKEALTDDVGAVLALNSRLSVLALEQIAAGDMDVMIGTFDQNNDVLESLIAGDMAFALDTSPFAQAWYTLSTMLNNQPAFHLIQTQIGVENPQDILQTFDIQLGPRLISSENAAAFLQVNRFAANQQSGE